MTAAAHTVQVFKASVLKMIVLALFIYGEERSGYSV
jgi:hypothetical protein